jgi:hypothetical protein
MGIWIGKIFSHIGENTHHDSRNGSGANVTLLHSRRDHRTRADRVQIQVDRWREQMPRLVRAYMQSMVGCTPEVNDSESSWTLPIYSFEGKFHSVL